MLSAFAEQYGDAFIPQPWIRYRLSRAPTAIDRQLKCTDSSRWLWAQPDGLFIFASPPARIILIEFKLRHTAEAWYQLRWRYEPLVHALFGPGWLYSCCEVVRWFAPEVRLPERALMAPEPSAIPNNSFAVHIRPS